MDFWVTDHFTLVLFTPLTAAARAWTEQHIADDALWHGDAFVAEPRYAGPIVEGILGAGLTVEG